MDASQRSQTGCTMSAASRYDELIALLDGHQAAYRVLTHAAEGRTDIVSAMRGNPIDHAAKCIIVMVKVGKKTTRYVLAVVPGGSRVDLAQVKKVLGGTYAAFASPNVAEELAGSVVGGLTSGVATWPSQRSQARESQLAREIHCRGIEGIR